MRFKEMIHSQTVSHFHFFMDGQILWELREIVAGFVNFVCFNLLLTVEQSASAQMFTNGVDHLARCKQSRKNRFWELTSKSVFKRRQNLHTLKRIKPKFRNIRVYRKIARALFRNLIDFL